MCGGWCGARRGGFLSRLGERNSQYAGRWIAIFEREGADGCEHTFVVREDAAKMFALVFGKAAPPLADDVGQLGFDFLRLLGSQIGARLRFVARMMGGSEQLSRRKRKRGSKRGALAEETAGDSRSVFGGS